uniref:Hypothetical secreted ESEH peptide n=1 Tax=Simulium guianense TaxID=445764 RepID=F5GTP6_SIMGU
MKFILLALLVGLVVVTAEVGTPVLPPTAGQSAENNGKSADDVTVTAVLAESEHIVLPDHLTNLYK